MLIARTSWLIELFAENDAEVRQGTTVALHIQGTESIQRRHPRKVHLPDTQGSQTSSWVFNAISYLIKDKID